MRPSRIVHLIVPHVFVYVRRSTDSQLKLWNVDASGCQRTFKGHVNEKNFVGLATNGEYIACGERLLMNLGSDEECSRGV